MGDLHDQTAAIVGAGRGLGRAAAQIKPTPDVTHAEWEHVFAMNARSVLRPT